MRGSLRVERERERGRERERERAREREREREDVFVIERANFGSDLVLNSMGLY